MTDLYQISENHNLEIVELTAGRNGYPSNISKAIDTSNLDSFEEVKEIAEAYDLEIISIHQKDGWHFWENKGWTNKAISVDASCFGDNYSEIPLMDEEDFIENEVKSILESAKSFDEIQAILDCKKEIWDQVNVLEENEIVITHEGNYHETFQRETLSFSEDTHNFKIALIEK